MLKSGFIFGDQLFENPNPARARYENMAGFWPGSDMISSALRQYQSRVIE